MTDLTAQIRQRYLQTLEQIAAAARRAGRRPEDVRLVVVTKAQPLAVVQAAIQAGVVVLGENYPEEAVEKIRALPNAGVEWHMIGHVQSRKADLVAGHFAMLHSLDNLRLANRLERFCAETGRRLPVLLEFNVGDEESKFGWQAGNESRWSDFLPEIETILTLPHLEVRGLMCMPPLAEQPEASRPYFRLLRRLQDFLARRFPSASWNELSMGTSIDYVVGVEEGATLVRIGTAIVGPRPPRA
ncbi:MAG: YggS family pyridoxal phosphate-dependent enzyme [Candidatus Villigracilaceae bacterium]